MSDNGLSPERLTWMYTQMARIREFEERVKGTFEEHPGVIRGHTHLADGAEASIVGSLAALRPDDQLTSTYRGHGYPIALGTDTKALMAEIFGKETGICKGYGGSMHFVDVGRGFLGTSGIVGQGIPHAAGAAWAAQIRGQGQVVLSFFGDGASKQGAFHETLNIASLWHLPVLLVCENNSTGSWAQGQGYPTLVHASSDLCSIAGSVSIATMRVDGADAGAVHAAASDALAQCRAGKGPIFIEAVTRRWPGSNPLWPEPATGTTDIRMGTGEIAPGGEHADWLQHHDPVLRLARTLARGPDAIARLAALDAAVRARIDDAVRFALESPFPAAETAFDRVFA